MSDVSRGRVVAGAGLGLGAILAAPSAAVADDFQVTNLQDEVSLDQIPGSLREAVIDAGNNPGADRIVFDSRLSGTISLDNFSVYLYGGPVEIIGPGARKVTIDGHGDSRIFTIDSDTGSATISGLTMTRGSADDGGAINVDHADLTVIGSAITNSTAAGGPGFSDAGGIYTLADSSTPEELVIENSTISGNVADDEGGGIYTSEVDLTLRNSTVSGNRARLGGGIYLESSPDTDEISNSTVTRNAATQNGGGIRGGPVDIFGSIVAGNTAAIGPDLFSGSPFHLSYTLIGDTGGATSLDDQGGSLLNSDPKLKPLKDNGGPTDTHAFKRSPAKNKIPKGQTPKNDQRGAKRKGKGDIGAYELVKCEGVIVNRVGTAKKDKLKGTKKADGILGLGGNDKLSGKKGKDGLCGGSGKDKLKGGPGKDKLNGGPGKDKEIQ